MGWLSYIVFTESGTYYSIANNLGQVQQDTIETIYQAL